MHQFSDEFLRKHYGYGQHEDLSGLRAVHEKLDRQVAEAGPGQLVLLVDRDNVRPDCHMRCHRTRWRFWMGVLESGETILQDGGHELPIRTHAYSDSLWHSEYGEPELHEGNLPFMETMRQLAFRWTPGNLDFVLMIGDEEVAWYPRIFTLGHAPAFDLVKRMAAMLGREELSLSPLLNPELDEDSAELAVAAHG